MADRLRGRIRHAVRGLTPGYFAPLVAAMWWRHRVHRVPFRYEATLWSVVFPLGMYAVAGIYLGQADRLPVVGAIGSAELWIAFAVWALILVGMLVHVTRTVFLPPGRRAGAGQRAVRTQRGPRGA